MKEINKHTIPTTSMRYFLYCTLIIIWIIPASLLSKTIHGQITSGKENLPLAEVKVMIENTFILTYSDSDGYFTLEYPNNLKTITIIAYKKDFFTSVIPNIPQDSLTHPLLIRMYPGNEEEYVLFFLGNIVVTSDFRQLPEKAETEYKITRNEIVHFQALDISKTLELLPGTNIQGTFSMDKIHYPILRYAQPISIANSYTLLGTKILLNGIDIHNRNNLNFNNFAALLYSNNSVFLGADLRLIPVDNVESISVLPDIAPSEYGEFLQGVVRVKTTIPGNRKILKINRTGKILHSGLQLGISHSPAWKQQFYLFITRDEKNQRIHDDSFLRAGFQHTVLYKNKKRGLQIENHLFFSRIFEKYQNEGLGIQTHDATMTFGLSNQLRKGISSRTEFIQNISLNTTYRDDYTKRYTITSGAILSPLTETGTAIGIPVTQPYFAETTLSGLEYSFSLKEKIKHTSGIGNIAWSSVTGMEWKLDGNQGDGLQMDPLKPPKNLQEIRPRSFKDIPVTQSIALFTDQSLTFRKIFPQELVLGVRVDGYNPVRNGGIHFRNGFYVNPRIRYRLRLSRRLQLRTGYGVNSMPPALYDLYPRPYYYTILDSSNLSQPVVSTYKFELDQPRLKGLRQRKFHLAMDFLGFKFFKGTINLYDQKLYNIPTRFPNPQWIVRKKWTDWPNTYEPLDTIIVNSSSLYTVRNSLWQKDQGIEFTLSINLLQPLRIRIQNSLHYQKTIAFYELVRRYSNLVSINWQGEQKYAIPVYPHFQIERENFQYRTMIHFVSRELGLWITFNGFFILKNHSKSRESLLLFPKYLIIDERNINISENDLEPGDAEKLKLFTDQMYRGFNWPFHYYFNLNVSKSITRGVNISFTVNNFLDIQSYYRTLQNILESLNPGMNFSIELEANLDQIIE